MSEVNSNDEAEEVTSTWNEEAAGKRPEEKAVEVRSPKHFSEICSKASNRAANAG